MNSTKKLLYLCVIVIELCCPTFVYAWGELGHELIGDVAETQLTPKTREAITELLGDRTLADVSTWADKIKGQRPETRPWHYANPKPGAESFDLERDNPDQSCVVEQINLDLAVLRDPESTHVAKVEALMFLVHFVGDVHQPMHLGWEADRGGNSIKVTFKGHKTNLHSLWDTGLLVETGLSRDDYRAGLLKLAQQLKVGALDPVLWANESMQLANSNAYVVPKSGQIGDAYYRLNIRVVNDRLALAGLRLAALLNDLYDPPDQLFTQPTTEQTRIVYAIATPGINSHVMRYRYDELCKAIDGLSDESHFTVIFYQGDRQAEPPPRGLINKPAREAVKERVKAWLDPEAGNIKPINKSDTLATLRQAFNYKPDVVYLWVNKMAVDDVPAMLDKVDRMNESGAIVHCIQWSYNPEADREKEPGPVEMLAEYTGGTHRYYGNKDVVQGR